MDLAQKRIEAKEAMDGMLCSIEKAEAIISKHGKKDFNECTLHLFNTTKDFEFVHRSLGKNLETYEAVVSSLGRFGFEAEVAAIAQVREMVEALKTKNRGTWAETARELDVMRGLCEHDWDSLNGCRICGECRH